MSDNGNCTSCGDGDRDDNPQAQPNPIDPCTRSFMQCENPCAIKEHNTVACESLPSRVENFTKNFFGDVIKTEVNGTVTWSLPCGLDVGLPANPRGMDEGLACYFLRLFNDGIIGLMGDPGAPGAPGAHGHNAFTVVLRAFNTPAVGQTVTVNTLYNPGILVNSFIFVDTSGWYEVVGKDLFGNLRLTLILASPGAGYVPAGKLAVPSGEPGQAIPGSPGDKGDLGPPGPNGFPGNTGLQGPAGAAGNNFLANNAVVANPGASNFDVTAAAYANVTFGGNFGFTAGNVGTYFVSVSWDWLGVAVNPGDAAVATISNTTLGTQPLGAFTSVLSTAVGTGGQLNATLQGLITTTAPNQIICVQAQAPGSSGSFAFKASTASLNWMQIA